MYFEPDQKLPSIHSTKNQIKVAIPKKKNKVPSIDFGTSNSHIDISHINLEGTQTSKIQMKSEVFDFPHSIKHQSPAQNFFSKQDWKKQELEKALKNHEEKETINIFLEKEKKKNLLKLMMDGEKARKFEIKKNPGAGSQKYYGSSENFPVDSHSSEENIVFVNSIKRKPSKLKPTIAKTLTYTNASESNFQAKKFDIERIFLLSYTSLKEESSSNDPIFQPILKLWHQYVDLINERLSALEQENFSLSQALKKSQNRNEERRISDSESTEVALLRKGNQYLKYQVEMKEEESLRLQKKITFLEQKNDSSVVVYESYENRILALKDSINKLQNENNFLRMSVLDRETMNDVGIDTEGLVEQESIKTDTFGLFESAFQSKGIQTLYWDELEDYQVQDAIDLEVEGRLKRELRRNKDERSLIFDFGKECRRTREEELGFEELTLTKVSEVFTKDINGLLNRFEKELKMDSIDGLENLNIIQGNRIKVEQFFKNIKNRDKAKTLEINHLKLAFIEQSSELEEIRSEFLKSIDQFGLMKSKFENYFHHMLKLKKKDNVDSLSNYSAEMMENPLSLETIPSISNTKANNKKRLSQAKSLQTSALKSKGWISLNQKLSILPKLKILKSLKAPDQSINKKSGFNKNFKPATQFEIDLPVESNNKVATLPSSQKLIPLASSGDILASSSFETLKKIEISLVLKAAEDKHHEFKMSNRIIERKSQHPEDDEYLTHLINEVDKNLSCKKFWINIESAVEERCSAFLLKVKAGAIKEVNNVSLKTVLKSIMLVQTILIKMLHQDRNRKLSPLIYFLYDCLYNKYNKSVEETERKMIKIMQGCMNFLHLPRIQNYATLLNILPKKPTTYDGHDLNFYCQLLSQLDDNSTIHISGLSLAISPQDHVYIGLQKAADVLQKFCTQPPYFGFISKTKSEKTLEEIKNTKIDDPIVFRRHVVDVDFVINHIFLLKNSIYYEYENVFKSVDLNLNQTINYRGFSMIMRNIENLDEFEINRFFFDEADFSDYERKEKFISFRKFANFCLKNNLCSPIRQIGFLRKCRDSISNFDQLTDVFDLKKNLIKVKLIKAGMLDSFHRVMIKTIVDSCRKVGLSEEEKNIAFLRYRLIDDEASFQNIKLEMEKCMSEELLIIATYFNKLQK